MSDSKTSKVPPVPPRSPGTTASGSPAGKSAVPTAPSRAGSGAPPLRPGAAATPAKTAAAQPSGKVVHDERGNAVWDWLKQTSRIAIESTSRLLRKLEAPELKVEDTQDNELRLMPDGKSCAGGGYDPYNQTNKGKPGRK